MSGPPAIYCSRCHVLRAIDDWRAHGDALLIALEPCGHVVHRDAGLEWRVGRRPRPLSQGGSHRRSTADVSASARSLRHPSAGPVGFLA